MLYSRKATVNIKGKAWDNNLESLISNIIYALTFKRQRGKY